MLKAIPLRRLCLFGGGGGGEGSCSDTFFLHFAERFFTPTPPISCFQHLLLLHGSGSVLMFCIVLVK